MRYILLKRITNIYRTCRVMYNKKVMIKYASDTECIERYINI